MPHGSVVPILAFWPHTLLAKPDLDAGVRLRADDRGESSGAMGHRAGSALSLRSAQAVRNLARRPDPAVQPGAADARKLAVCWVSGPGEHADQALGTLCGGRNAPAGAGVAVGSFALASWLSATRWQSKVKDDPADGMATFHSALGPLSRGRRGPVRPVDVWFEVDDLGCGNRGADPGLRVVDRGGDVGTVLVCADADLRGEQQLVGPEMHGAQVDDTVHARRGEQRRLDGRELFRHCRLTDDQALRLHSKQDRNRS